MLSLETGTVTEILYQDRKIQILNVNIQSRNLVEKAINYVDETGICNITDRVVLNSIGNRLKLGTGGYNFVYYNISNKMEAGEIPGREYGHIIKMKYTPGQLRVKTVEEKVEYQNVFNDENKLSPRPVIFAILHSMLSPLVTTIKNINPDLKISCIYTYGGAMNSNNSFILKKLRYLGLIDSIITTGECYGGDYESINIATGILFGYSKLNSDILVVCCGPGVAGSSTYFGFSTFEFVGWIYIAKLLGVLPVLIPRVSMADKRERHRGLSMQSISILKTLNFSIDFPLYKDNRDIKGFNYIYGQLEKHNIINKHNVHIIDNDIIKKIMGSLSSDNRVMGRNYEEDPWFFNNCGSVGLYAVNALNKLKN